MIVDKVKNVKMIIFVMKMKLVVMTIMIIKQIVLELNVNSPTRSKQHVPVMNIVWILMVIQPTRHLLKIAWNQTNG